MAQDRVQNRHFMAVLVADAEVGGVLSEYMSKADVKTYIKDAILNKYSKNKVSEALSVDQAKIIRTLYKHQPTQVEKRGRVTLYSLNKNEWLVLAAGTFAKWETALKQALEYVAGLKGVGESVAIPKMLLMVSVKKADTVNADLEFVRRALALLKVDVHFVQI